MSHRLVLEETASADARVSPLRAEGEANEIPSSLGGFVHPRSACKETPGCSGFVTEAGSPSPSPKAGWGDGQKPLNSLGNHAIINIAWQKVDPLRVILGRG